MVLEPKNATGPSMRSEALSGMPSRYAVLTFNKIIIFHFAGPPISLANLQRLM